MLNGKNKRASLHHHFTTPYTGGVSQGFVDFQKQKQESIFTSPFHGSLHRWRLSRVRGSSKSSSWRRFCRCHKESSYEQKEPYDEQKEPSDEQKEPSDEQKEPYDEQKKPYDEQKEPYDEPGAPIKSPANMHIQFQ